MDISPHRRYIEDALRYACGTHAYEDVVKGVQAGIMQYWPAPNAVIITEVVTAPQKRILNLFLAGGSLAELEKMVPIIAEWGHSQGCVSVTLVGRKGWERTFLRRLGFTPTLVVFEAPMDVPLSR